MVTSVYNFYPFPKVVYISSPIMVYYKEIEILKTRSVCFEPIILRIIDFFLFLQTPVCLHPSLMAQYQDKEMGLAGPECCLVSQGSYLWEAPG